MGGLNIRGEDEGGVSSGSGILYTYVNRDLFFFPGECGLGYRVPQVDRSVRLEIIQAPTVKELEAKLLKRGLYRGLFRGLC